MAGHPGEDETVSMLRILLRRAPATLMVLLLAFAATVVCIAAAVTPATKVACTSMDSDAHTAIVNDCCAVDAPNSYASVAGSLQSAVPTPQPVVTLLTRVEPLSRPGLRSSGSSRNRGPRHGSDTRTHLFDAVFRI